MTKRLSVLFAMLAVFALVLSACGPAATEAPVVTEPPVVETEPPTPEPTEPPAAELGTPENPLIMALAPSAQSQELQTGGAAIAAELSKMTGYSIEVTVPASYGALVEAMASEQAHIGWLPPFTYILAKAQGYADVGLATVRFGSDHYSSQIVANAAGGYTSYYDAATGTNTADAATALAQFDGKKPCWTDPLSSSGYVIPLGVFREAGINVKAGAWVQGHPTVIKSIYLSPKGEICDFGATYAPTPDVSKDFPDVNEKVIIIFMTPPVIPNDNVSFAPGVPAEIRQKIVDALLAMAETEEGKALLKNGGYDIQGLKVVDDTFYDEFRVYLEASGVDTTSLMGK
ncbi:MAG: phosphate/phosphite/phosphonate ABC transporter substrate-binding protein [Anaerolineaceae bacterium]|nr:MAG: phosphate/phosphite/phosphonate ABC transporter substrate-binding protein [Anaerolineaceae bacterium]